MRLILTLLFFTCSVFLFGQQSFEYLFKHTANQWILDGVQDEDDNFYFVGSIKGNDYEAGYIIKICADGDTISKIVTNKDYIGFFSEIQILDDNELLIMGQTSSETSADENTMWFLKMNNDLGILDEKFYTIPKPYYYKIVLGYSLINQAGEIVIAGTAKYFPHHDFCMVKINSDLDTLMTRFYPNEFSQQVDDFVAFPNSTNYLMIGGKLGLYSSFIQAFTIDSALNITGIYNTPIDLTGSASVGNWISDDRYLMTCTLSDTTEYGNDDDFSIAVQIMDTAGVIHKHLYMGKPDTTDYSPPGKGIVYANDTTIYVGGFSTINGAFYDPIPTWFELYMIDTSLNLLGYSQYGGDANYTLFGMVPCNDGGCLMFGRRYGVENGPNEKDIYIKKVIRKEINIITSIKQITVAAMKKNPYPNPVSELIHIPIKATLQAGSFQLQIFDNSGRMIFDKQFTKTGNQLDVNVSTLKPGIYFFLVNDGLKLNINGKFVKH
ncbi:MAG: T9SS type A sorting domain-containing protein [Clostridia bacterium]|nr:T9SS type A sorting domain-containing protein [Clostridia bacterium]